MVMGAHTSIVWRPGWLETKAFNVLVPEKLTMQGGRIGERERWGENDQGKGEGKE